MSRVRFAVVTNESTATDRSLASAAPAGVAGYVLAPWETVAVLEPGDVALGRLTFATRSTVSPTACGASASWRHEASAC
jgi:hypothetical protein